MKLGSKLIWNKVSKTPIVKSNEDVPNISSSAGLLKQDRRITNVKNLSNLDICKTTDKTPESTPDGQLMRNGFPRPSLSVNGKASAKILVIPMSFEDLKFKSVLEQRGQLFTSDAKNLEELIPLVKQSFRDLSSNRFELEIDVLPKNQWWDINEPHNFSGVWGVPAFPRLNEIIKKYKSDFRFEGYDSFVFLTGSWFAATDGSVAQATFREKVKNSISGTYNGVLFGGSWTNSALWVHELGHSLFGFEDLYLFKNQGSNSNLGDFSVPMLWDLMANSTRGRFLNWNKFLIGWLKDSEVRCISNQDTSFHYLSTNSGSSDAQLLTINLQEGVTLAAEARLLSKDKSGLLLYLINTYVSHGDGPILTFNKLFSQGEIKNLFGWEFSVLDSTSEGLLLQVKKTDIDKFVVPESQKQSQSSSTPTPNSIITFKGGNIEQTGKSTGRANWQVSGHKSYRLYVTALDDFQKVYFESGFVNDSSNPLVIEISGLVCQKDLRTITEFYSEQNGKGERFVVENRQLTNLACTG